MYIVTKQLEKVVEFSLSKTYRDFKKNVGDRCIVISNNIRINNRVHEHPQLENALSHSFLQRMPKPVKDGLFGSFSLFDRVEHIKQPFGSAKSIRCTDCGFGVPYDHFLKSDIPSCEEHKAFLLKGPEVDDKDHDWTIKESVGEKPFGTTWICKKCKSTAYYTYSWNQDGVKWYWSVEAPRSDRVFSGTPSDNKSCAELCMDEAIG